MTTDIPTLIGGILIGICLTIAAIPVAGAIRALVAGLAWWQIEDCLNWLRGHGVGRVK